MSSSSSDSSSTVSLYRYDLTQGMARSMGPMLIGRPLEGIWHTSIVVFGKEYFFDGGSGITADPNPGRTRFGQPYRTEVLGQTRKRQDEFFVWTQQQRSSRFGPNDYHLLNNNCNSFSDAACVFLLGRHIPQDVLDMIPTLLSTPIGQMLRPMLEQATSGGAGIGGIGGGGGGNFGFAQPTPPQQPPQLPSGESCAGLLSTHQVITEEDEEELMLAQAMLESNETIADGPQSPPEAFEKAISGLTLLQTVMANICAHPTEAKYRALSVESNAYKTKLKALEPYGLTEVLRIAGFVRRPHSSGTGGEQWYLSDAAGSAVLLQRVGEMLAITISSIEGAAEDAARARAKATVPPTSATEREAATHAGGSLSVPPPPATAETASAVLRYCYPPFPKDWTPLPVGWESGAPLFSIHCLAGGGGGANACCFGKCRLSPDQQHLQAYYCSADGREVEVRGGYEVLCVRRGQEESLVWVPARMASTAAASAALTSSASVPFIFYGYGRFGVARSQQGCGLTPGVLEPSGRCVIPYGGKAVVVTAVAEVLCERARLPTSLAADLQAVQKGAELSQLLRVASGLPIGSFEELLHRWQPPAFYVPPQALQRHTCRKAAAVDWEREDASTTAAAAAPSSSSSSRLLVCHDFGGGYTAGERPSYVLAANEGAREERRTRTEKAAIDPPNLALVEGAYTVGYWDRVDTFVYFSHQRISVPPRGWIHEGHRRGVTVLGTIITEGTAGALDLGMLLLDAKQMALVIERLVQVCDFYGFDGYLVNIENALPPQLAKRLLVFCAQLRKQLNRAASLRGTRLVVWYDAVTIDGSLAYQNALTPKNKPFFDVVDGIFTNYFWNPVHIAMSRAAAGPRGADVYVGVDVFGRHMFGGGRYNSYVAVEEAVRAELSVALFAPGWTMECESGGKRDGFERAESKLWLRMQGSFVYHAPLLTGGGVLGTTSTMRHSEGGVGNANALRAWTSFQSNVGYDFYVNGLRVTARPNEGGVSAWCAPAAAHALPPFQYEAPDSHTAPTGAPGTSAHVDPTKQPTPFASVSFRLPGSSLKGSMYGGTVKGEWRYDKAWFGDRCLACVLPPSEAAELLRWHVRNALPGITSSGDATRKDKEAGSTPAASVLHVEVVLDDSEGAAVTDGSRGMKSAVLVESNVGLRLGLYAASRGTFYATVWVKEAATPVMVAVAGSEGLTAWMRTSRCGQEKPSNTNTEGVAIGDSWCHVEVALQNTAAETVHLLSLSLANGDRSRTLRVRVGGIALSQTPPPSPPPPPHNTDNAAEAGGVAAGAALPFTSLLRAAGPCVWTAPCVTYPTGRTGEQVVSLSGAGEIFASVRAEHGTRSTVVVFATVGAADHQESSEGGAPTTSVYEGDRLMHLGQYSVDPADGTMYEDAVLIPVSLPEERVVRKVIYYTIANGY